MVETGVTQRTCQKLREASCKCCVGFESKLQVSVSISISNFKNAPLYCHVADASLAWEKLSTPAVRITPQTSWTDPMVTKSHFGSQLLRISASLPIPFLFGSPTL